MKITNDQLKQIIKEELEAVMNESVLQALGVYKAGKASAARRRATQDSLPRGGYRRGYGGPSSSSNREVPQPQHTGPTPVEQDAMAAAASAEGLESLLRAKNAAAQALGVDEDGSLPYMYIFGGMGQQPEELLNTYYDGSMDFYDAIVAAKDAGELGENSIDDESGGFDLSELFPGK